MYINSSYIWDDRVNRQAVRRRRAGPSGHRIGRRNRRKKEDGRGKRLCSNGDDRISARVFCRRSAGLAAGEGTKKRRPRADLAVGTVGVKGPTGTARGPARLKRGRRRRRSKRKPCSCEDGRGRRRGRGRGRRRCFTQGEERERERERGRDEKGVLVK